LKKFRLKRTWPVAAVGLVGLVGLAYAATQVIEFTINTPVAVSEGGNGDKPKILGPTEEGTPRVFFDVEKPHEGQ
jgi:hypothetical protein